MNASLLYFYLRKANLFQPQAGWSSFLLKLLIALIVMSTVLHFVAGSDAVWLSYKLVPKLTHLLVLLALGAASYFATLWLMGVRIKDFIKRATI
jgi:putative peptidoglycan lipid II flippase